MPKFPPFESAIHQYLLHVRQFAEHERMYDPSSYKTWKKHILSLNFDKIDSLRIRVTWKFPNKGSYTFSTKDFRWYVRGDIHSSEKTGPNIVENLNAIHMLGVVRKIVRKAGFKIHISRDRSVDSFSHIRKRFSDEEGLSDIWANTVTVDTIDVVQMNESPTTPELRYIHTVLGDVRGKKILDIGCGLGEASVYFALKGANVSAMDLSGEMLSVAQKLARKNHVRIKTYQSSIELFRLSKSEQFDIIYVGNLFHHVDIEKALDCIQGHLVHGGTLVCWEPVAYNPIINVYRKIASQVRSKDEKPFRLSDIKRFTHRFNSVTVEWFWFTTLIIFMVMAVVQRRNPNKERYWKSVVKEGVYWKRLYVPLEKLDTIVLTIFPFLKPLCWNVVLVCKNSKKEIARV